MQAMLVFWGIVHWPITASLFFLGVVAAMGYELSRDTLRAAQLARELRESEQLATQAAEAANVGIWFQDLARNEIWANDQWRGLFGFAKSERLDLDRFFQRVHADDREALRQALAKSIESGGGYEMQCRVVLPNAELRWIASRGITRPPAASASDRAPSFGSFD